MNLDRVSYHCRKTGNLTDRRAVVFAEYLNYFTLHILHYILR